MMEKTNDRMIEKEPFRFITLSKDDIDKKHICCALSDKKCTEGYELKS